MAGETVYKDIPDLNAATVPLVGTEYIEVSATGTTGKAQIQAAFGVGWWAWLKAAFSSFKAPDADHADDADTVGGESASDLHDATALVGAIPLANIPAELTGKNAATATLADTATNALAVDGYSAGIGAGLLQPYRGFIHGNYTGAQIYAALSSVIPSVNDAIPISGGFATPDGGSPEVFAASRLVRTSSTQITIYGVYAGTSHSGISSIVLSAGSGFSPDWSFTY